ncbi:hypothetical protein RclHR1_03170012 [Rhizophagus clarus]|uniref:Uncharacterized protein n=1 Tax=Rhizophagus clarus TaxID=94130 RepID=A0A2Z6S1K0_9GLOM|nr:hypothetical protein RclHR1_03170012 [Rhizophagus clarus]GET00493.1 hypothetical protein RCL_jg3392.t1 [Rhizophagus clarus]
MVCRSYEYHKEVMNAIGYSNSHGGRIPAREEKDAVWWEALDEVKNDLKLKNKSNFIKVRSGCGIEFENKLKVITLSNSNQIEINASPIINEITNAISNSLDS